MENSRNEILTFNLPRPKRNSAQRKSIDMETMDVDRMTSREFQIDTNAHIDTAAQLLKDDVRIRFFKSVIECNKHLFRGRTVLNVGSGIGTLALFAAKAGAARVYAVDWSNVSDYAKRIVHANGFSHIITVIKGRIEEVKLPTDEVDIILCDWMGYSLLFQSICDAVIFARDKWLKKGTGLIFPDKAELFFGAMEDDRHRNDRVEWWKDVYGFNMTCLRECALSEPCFRTVRHHQVLSNFVCVKLLNLYTAKYEDLKFRCKYILHIVRSGHLDGIVTFFNVSCSKSHIPMGLTTGPSAPATHWMQTVFFFDQPIPVNTDQVLYGGFEMSSPEGKCNLNNLEVGFEMLTGDPLDMRVITEMTWKLRPNCAAPVHYIEDDNAPPQKQDEFVPAPAGTKPVIS